MGWFTTSSTPEPKDVEPIKPTHTLESEALALNSDEEQHLSQPSDLSSTTTGDDEKAAEIQAAQAAYIDYSHTQRLNLPPYPRISLTFATAGGYGFMSGFYGGFKLGSLRYLALNAHRLPKTKGGWYFYHKRKNYVVLKQGLQLGFKTAAKYGFVSAGYMGLEAYIDHARGTIDAFSTIGSALIFGTAYAAYSKFTKIRVQFYIID